MDQEEAKGLKGEVPITHKPLSSSTDPQEELLFYNLLMSHILIFFKREKSVRRKKREREKERKREKRERKKEKRKTTFTKTRDKEICTSNS